MTNIPEFEKINGFQSPSEFKRFEEWITRFAQDGLVDEVKTVSGRYSGITVFYERWFRDKRTGVIWRLVSPDFPFRGVFEIVNEKDNRNN